MTFKNLSLFVVVAMVCSVSTLSQTTEAKHQPSDAEILDADVHSCFDDDENPIRFDGGTTVTNQFFNLHRCLSVPVGIVFTPGITLYQYKFSPSGAKARDVLESIVNVVPNYKWSIENGVINLIPTGTYLPLLDYRFREFKATGSELSMFMALEDSQELRAAASEFGFEGPEIYAGFSGFTGPRKDSVSCEGCSVKDILNSISRLRAGAWVYLENWHHQKKRYRFGNFSA